MKETINQIKKAINGERALQDVREIANFHRIQASTGYRRAAEWVAARLKAEGLPVQIHSYPANKTQWYFQYKMFQEWDVKGGWLKLVSPHEKMLADFSTNNLHICPKSYPCDYRNKPLDIVLMDKGKDPKAYEGWDLKGKLLFVRGPVSDYVDWAITQTGALGFITDYMRELKGTRSRYDLQDTLNYISFWWNHLEGEAQTFGFTLTPRQGDKLAMLCLDMRAAHEADPQKPAYPQATCLIDSSLYDGSIEIVEAYLPGTTDESIIVTAHLCHPRSSANDNASGVAAAIEALRTLNQLLLSGALPPLKRGIRMIFMPEFTGTFPYLDELGAEGRAKIRAGINLDMVGARQGKGYGPLTISGVPHALPTFVTSLAALVLDEVKYTQTSLSGSTAIPMFNSKVTGFEAGSDHQILSDPTIGIPTPMLGQWPDMTYHTSSDTIEVIDPFILHKSASICAGYCYVLSTLNERHMISIMNKGREEFVGLLTNILFRATEDDADVKSLYKTYLHLLKHAQSCIRSFASFFDDPATLERVNRSIFKETQLRESLAFFLWTRFAEELAPDFTYETSSIPQEYAFIPVRKYSAPVIKLRDIARGDARKIKAIKEMEKLGQNSLRAPGSFEAMVQYYIDGQHTLWEIAQEVIIEMHDGSVEYVDKYVRLLHKLGLVDLVPAY